MDMTLRILWRPHQGDGDGAGRRAVGVEVEDGYGPLPATRGMFGLPPSTVAKNFVWPCCPLPSAPESRQGVSIRLV